MDLTLLARERIGKVLRGKYHLDRLIDVGGMAAVYEATHRNGTRSAIKVLHPKYVSDVQARTRFLREGYAANHVGHPGSVTVLDDDFTEEGDVYLVMELLDGESLEGCIAREKQMNEIDVLSIADQLLDVLSSAHHKDIIHRDIKPANIMLTRSGIVKLLDFGLARVRELPAVAGVHSAEIVFGTVAYVSPEAARANNDEMDGRADLWAVAATMFKALAGETVHGMDGSVMERLIRAARNQARSLGDVVPHLHPRVIDVVDRALMFHPDDRWPSAAVMQAVVQDVLAQLMEERAVPPSLFFMPGLSQAAAGYTASGPMASMSAMATPTPRPYRGQVATPSPSPYPHPGLPAQAANPLNRVVHNPLNQIRGRPARQQPPQQQQQQQQQQQRQQGYMNPLNQLASRRQVQATPQPRAQRRPVNPLNQIATRSGAQWRSHNEPQNRGPATYDQVARGQNHAPTSSDSSFEIDIDDLDGGADLSYNALDVTITIEEDIQDEPETRPRRATTMRDLGSAAARARAMLARRRGEPEPEPEPEPELDADDFDIDFGFDGDGGAEIADLDTDDLRDMSQEDPLSAIDEDDDGQFAGTSEDTVRRPPPSLPSEETVRRRAPTRPPEDGLPEAMSGELRSKLSAPSGMDSGIIIEELDDEQAWPENDLWDLPAVPEFSGQDPSSAATGKPISGLLGMPPLVTGSGPTKEEREVEAAGKQRVAAEQRAAASVARKAALEAKREAAAAKRAELRERREAQAKEAAALRQEERRRRAPPVTGTRKTGLDRLAGLRRSGKSPSAPMVIDSDSSMSTPPDRTVRFSIRAPTTLPDLEAQRSKPAPMRPRTERGGDEEGVDELSDSMFIRVPEGSTSKSKVAPPRRSSAPQRTSVPPQRTPVPPQRSSVPSARTPAPPVRTPAPPVRTPAPSVRSPAPPVRTPAPPVRTPSVRVPAPPLRTPVPPQRTPVPPQRKPTATREAAKKPDESLKALRLPHLRKPPRDK